MLAETGLSPERLSDRLGISNLTYRRWLKKPPSQHIPKKYERDIAGGVYQLLSEGQLSHDSKTVGHFLEHNLPEFFQAALGQFRISEELFAEKSSHQDKITSVLLHIGNNVKARERVKASAGRIQKFSEWGAAWKDRITILTKTIQSKQLAAIDKFIAYGALFYLVLPFDMVPDTIPVFGYIDDFGVLGFAVAYYLKKYPDIFPDRKSTSIV
ncbi:MAG TPA: YkvA family protein [Alphaproteobacteria bacterium]|nr:YkvA family protein [Alphaproteobacteria bacterium]